MFGGKGRPARQAALKAIMDAKMLEGTLVRDHMICMIRLFNEMEILGVEIDGETQIDMVLETLPDSFKQLKLNYNINKMMMGLPELMRELQTIEGIIKDQKGIYMAVKCSSGSFSQKKNTIKSTKQKGKFKGKRKKKKSKGQDKCFLCGQKSHWKKECPKFLKRQLGMHHSLLVKSCLLLDSTNSWWIDFEATDHVCNSLQGFQVRRRLNDGDMYLKLASKARVVVQVVGDVTLMQTLYFVLLAHSIQDCPSTSFDALVYNCGHLLSCF